MYTGQNVIFIDHDKSDHIIGGCATVAAERPTGPQQSKKNPIQVRGQLAVRHIEAEGLINL